MPSRTNTWVLSLAAIGLALFATVSERAAIVALPLGALLLLVVVILGRPRTSSARLLLLGSAFWAIEECVWAWGRLSGSLAPTLVTDVGSYGGALFWFVALLLMPGTRRPSLLSVAFVPALAILIWLSTQDPPLTIALRFPVTDLLLAVASIPALEGSLRGRASEGRLLLTLGLFVRALTAGAFTWLFDVGGLTHGFYLLWLLPYLFLALGMVMESRDEPVSLWASAATLVGLEAATGLMLVLLYRSGELTTGYSLGIVVLLGYFQFVGVMMLLLSDRRRRVQAEQELRSWGGLLDRVLTVRTASAGALGTLEQLLVAIEERIPEATGVEVYADANLRAGTPRGYAYPLVSGGTEVGRLYFRRQPLHIDVLDAVAPFLAGRIQQTLDQVAWQEHAITDPLTGLLNRRGFDLRLPEVAALVNASASPLTVVMLDIDHFKRVNDIYDHATGDRALCEVAKVLSENVRSEDVAMRWGGEEFVVVLSDADLDVASEAVRRIRSSLRARVIKPIAWPLTMSAGLAGGRPPTGIDEIRDWIGQADKALHRAKDSGRDRMETFA